MRQRVVSDASPFVKVCHVMLPFQAGAFGKKQLVGLNTILSLRDSDLYL